MKQILFFILVIITLESKAQVQFSSYDNEYSEYKIGTIFISTLNVTLTSFNIINFNNENKQKHDAIFGIIMGLGQFAYAFTNPQHDQKPELSFINYSLATTSIMVSCARLINPQPTLNPSVKIFYPFDNKARMSLGFSLKKTI